MSDAAKYQDRPIEQGKHHLPKIHSSGLAVITQHADAPPERPGFVLVHGAMDRKSSFRRLANKLSDFPVTYYDRRGYADSLKLAGEVEASDVSASSHVSDLLGLISERPCIVFGHSMGGTLALLAAMEKPANLLGILTFETPLPFEPWWPTWPAEPSELIRGINREESSERAEKFMIKLIGEGRWLALPEKTREQRRLEGFTLISEMSSLAAARDHFDPRKLDIPLVATVGEHSAERHQSAQLYLLRSSPNVRAMTILDANHGAHLSHSDAVAELCVLTLKLTAIAR